MTILRRLLQSCQQHCWRLPSLRAAASISVALLKLPNRIEQKRAELFCIGLGRPFVRGTCKMQGAIRNAMFVDDRRPQADLARDEFIDHLRITVDRQSVVSGKSVSVRVDLGCRCTIKKKK